MRITNKHNLPEAIYNAVSGVYRPKEDRFSVTALIDAPQIRQLTMKHWDEIEDDASNRLWALLGSSMHYAIEKGSPADSIPEEKLTYFVNGVTVVGKADLYHNKEIHDYKITSTFSFLLGDKPQWEAQLQLNCLLFRRAGFEVESLRIYAILRDWMESKTLSDERYPVIPFQEVSFSPWTMEAQERYLLARIEAHQAENPQCSDEERWRRPSQWAVQKPGRKSALRVLDTEDEALRYMGTVSDTKGLYIQERKGSYVRCTRFCAVRDVCLQAKQDHDA